MEKKEPSPTAGGTANWYSHYGKTVCRFLKTLRINFPYDPTIPPLRIYPKDLKTHIPKDIHTLMFTAALFTLFTVARTWKQLKRPTIDN